MFGVISIRNSGFYGFRDPVLTTNDFNMCTVLKTNQRNKRDYNIITRLPLQLKADSQHGVWLVAFCRLFIKEAYIFTATVKI